MSTRWTPSAQCLAPGSIQVSPKIGNLWAPPGPIIRLSPQKGSSHLGTLMVAAVALTGGSFAAGFLLGLRFKVPAIIAASVVIVGAGVLTGSSLWQTLAALATLQGAYMLGLCVRYRGIGSPISTPRFLNASRPAPTSWRTTSVSHAPRRRMSRSRYRDGRSARRSCRHARRRWAGCSG